MSEPRTESPQRAAVAILAFMALSALMAGLYPMGFAIGIVALFSGPHNWAELRFLLARSPTGWGPLRTYFLSAVIGVTLLSAGAITIGLMARTPGVHFPTLYRVYSLWGVGLVLWILWLVWLREPQKPRRSWPWVRPLGALLLATAWTKPALFSLFLVYLHPLMSLWILDRELYRRRSTVRGAYHRCLATIPLFMVGMWWLIGPAAPVGRDYYTNEILRQGGADIFTQLHPHFCVAAHAFLEMLHYGVWLLAFPLASGGSLRALRDPSWLAARFPSVRLAVRALLTFSTLMVVVLWVGFYLSPGWTRQTYFIFGIIHVVTEMPALLRMI